MSPLDARRVSEYFSSRDTVATWWSPEEGPLAFMGHLDLAWNALDPD